MIALDTNVLVHSFRAELPLHRPACELVDRLMNGSEPWAICWPSIHEFMATVTRIRYFDPPTPPDVALEAVRQWAASPSLRLLTEASDHLDRLQALMAGTEVRGPLIHDARVAAICLSHAVQVLVTFDRDFDRFPQLAVRGL